MSQQFKMQFKIIKSKKAQFYIITAVVLIAAVFLYSSSRTETPKYQSVFHEISENYFNEAPYVLNAAMITDANKNEKMENFTKNFINYAKTKTISMGIVYVFSDSENITVGNFMKEAVTCNSFELLENQTQIFNMTENMSVSIDGNQYDFNITENSFKSIAKEYGEDYIIIELRN